MTTELDDFREGCPPCRGLITQGLDKGFFPPIYHRAPRPAGKRRQNSLRREAALGSRLSPARQARKAFLADVEAQLSPHPLALYPDLEEDLPAEVTSWPRVVGRCLAGPGEHCSLDAWGVPSRG